MARAGLWDQSPVVEDIRAARFPMIVIAERPPASIPEAVADRWTTEMLTAIHDAYTPTDQLAGNTVYRPKNAARAP
jgi:hypothetical protein